MTAITGGMFFFFSAQNIIIPAAMADVADYGRLRFGRDQAGTYFALFTMGTKINIGLGAATGFFVADRFGFDPAVKVHDATAVLGIKLAFAGLPSLCALVAIVLILGSRFDAARRAIVRRRLDRLDAAATAPAH
jgi:Na+/melibiose symporter-like transporter